MISRKFRILHTDDDKFILGLYKKVFEKEGFEVVCLSKLSDDFIAEIVTIKPDLIISDILKPEIDGLHFLKAIKADDRTKNIPFIFLSNQGDRVEIDEAMKLGALKFFVKSDISSLGEVAEEIKKLFNL